jgi:L-threonylcarbamoyladenylate synthase
VTSANLTGRPPAQTVTEAQEQLGASVAVYLDGGPASGGPASTILDCTAASPVTLREGPLTRPEVDRVLDEAEKREAAEAARKAAAEAAAAAPSRGRAGPRIAGSRRRR